MRRGRAVAGIYSLPRAEVETGTRGWMDVLRRAVRRVAYLATGASPTLAVACAASALGGTGNGVQWVALITTVQELTRAVYQARVLCSRMGEKLQARVQTRALPPSFPNALLTMR